VQSHFSALIKRVLTAVIHQKHVKVKYAIKICCFDDFLLNCNVDYKHILHIMHLLFQNFHKRFCRKILRAKVALIQRRSLKLHQKTNFQNSMKIEFLFAALNLNLLSVKKITRKNARFMDGVYFIII